MKLWFASIGNGNIAAVIRADTAWEAARAWGLESGLDCSQTPVVVKDLSALTEADFRQTTKAGAVVHENGGMAFFGDFEHDVEQEG